MIDYKEEQGTEWPPVLFGDKVRLSLSALLPYRPPPKVCGPCEHCKDGCPYTDEDTRIQLPGDVMEQAGFSRGVRLDMRIGDHEVILSEAESYDLRDVPPEVRKTLQQLGICLDELDGLLAGGDVIYEG